LKGILETQDETVEFLWLTIVTSNGTEPSSYTKCEEIFTSWATNSFRSVCFTQVITHSSAIKSVIDNHVTLIRRVSGSSRPLNIHIVPLCNSYLVCPSLFQLLANISFKI